MYVITNFYKITQNDFHNKTKTICKKQNRAKQNKTKSPTDTVQQEKQTNKKQKPNNTMDIQSFCYLETPTNINDQIKFNENDKLVAKTIQIFLESYREIHYDGLVPVFIHRRIMTYSKDTVSFKLDKYLLTLRWFY